MTHIQIFGILSSIMILCSRANYFNSIFRGKTRPHAFSWFIWGTISSIGVAAQISEGAGAGAWARALGSATCFLLVVIALIKGENSIKRSDWITLAVALTAIPLWVITDTPVWSVFLVCAIDTIGYYPTLRKSWHKPYEEAARSYMFSALSSFFSVLAVEHYSIATWFYPAVLTVTNGTMVAFLLWRRHQLKSGPLHVNP